ncbi:helix-turn-helix domain-containing protein [Candidatus Enterococcus murrayae]|uniref:Helix-turn-helix domain-containing protein n=1 Tax=Candidatus Enterococcus murrayae TaxID=2815321 RepID=A0ABS3HL84_9ENTE|nr:helix-turn-helix domain-containing protein [Enterococcus sp. MJM16]MBO0454209.1 helix-turn-helix domain-containing protein [Enterococcus sp. MJM16]
MDFRQVLGVSNRRRLKLIELLYYNRDGTPSEKLTSELKCSLPILLSDISLINAQQNKYFLVEKDNGLYQVKLMEDISIGKLYAEALTHSPEFQIVEKLLYEEHDNISTLSKSLFLSSSNAQRYLKKLEPSLKKAGIYLCYRPLRLEGEESTIRHFYYRYFIEKHYSLKTVLPNLNDFQLRSIEKFVQEFVSINGLYKKHIFQKRLTYTIFISLWRMKNGHYFPAEALRTEGLLLPDSETIIPFKSLVSDVFGLSLTDEVMRDCLWLSYSDAVVFSKAHREQALADNSRYRQLFKKHLTLTNAFMKLMGDSPEEERVLELTTTLVNAVYLYDERGEFVSILRKNRTIFLKMVEIMHQHAVEKVTEITKTFVQTYGIYQNKDFITNYVYLLLTAEVDSLERLASQDQILHLLLISDLSPTEEEFISKVITQIVYGNFEIHHFEDIWDGDEELIEKILTYDGLITTGSREGLPKEFPLVSMDPYITPQSIVAIQNLVNELSEKLFKKSLAEKENFMREMAD